MVVYPSDMVGEAIIELSSNLAKLKEFMNVVNKQSLVNESNRSVVLNVKRRVESLKNLSSVFKVQKVMHHLLKRWQLMKQKNKLKSQKIL